jgi:hypothetical protein
MRNVLNYLLSMLIGIAVGIACYGSYQSHTHKPEPEPQIQYIYVDKEKIVEVPVEVEVPVYVNEEFYRTLTEDDAYYLKDMAMREAEGEGVQGMLWVMYCMECRRKAFGGSYGDVWKSDAFNSSWNRRGITPNEDCLQALALFEEGWMPEPLYFRCGNYHNFGTPLAKVGNHYFSTM